MSPNLWERCNIHSGPQHFNLGCAGRGERFFFFFFFEFTDVFLPFLQVVPQVLNVSPKDFFFQFSLFPKVVPRRSL
jgi:hypothetical protein